MTDWLITDWLIYFHFLKLNLLFVAVIYIFCTMLLMLLPLENLNFLSNVCECPCLQEGVSPTDLDRKTKSMGFPVGSATLIDEVGIDVGAHIADYISGVYGSRFGFGAQETGLLKEMVRHGYLGTVWLLIIVNCYFQYLANILCQRFESFYLSSHWFIVFCSLTTGFQKKLNAI